MTHISSTLIETTLLNSFIFLSVHSGIKIYSFWLENWLRSWHTSCLVISSLTGFSRLIPANFSTSTRNQMENNKVVNITVKTQFATSAKAHWQLSSKVFLQDTANIIGFLNNYSVQNTAVIWSLSAAISRWIRSQITFREIGYKFSPTPPHFHSAKVWSNN